MRISRSDQRYLDKLQRDTFQYFWQEADPRSGLVPDNTSKGAPSSIAAVGLALATYAVGVERHCISRKQGIERTLATLRFFALKPKTARMSIHRRGQRRGGRLNLREQRGYIGPEELGIEQNLE